MGLLDLGTPLDWEESGPYREYVKEHGVTQFIHIYNTLKHRHNDPFLWGDEIEYIIIHMDPETKKTRVSLKGKHVQQQLEAAYEQFGDDSLRSVTFHPEYAMYMIEGTPGRPYEGFTADLRLVEVNMALRRKLIQEALDSNEYVVSITTFPLLGVGEFCIPWDKVMGSAARSQFVPDSLINDHPRFPCLTRNIRHRRGSNVCITVPMYIDENTAASLAHSSSEEKIHALESDFDAEKRVDSLDHIYMDCMAFGMGSCCLQITFQTRSISEARVLYDQLAVLTPLFLALSAGTPFLKGFISDFDVRWTVISQSVDDRTPEERGLAGSSEKKIAKSRYDSISCYISNDPRLKNHYNDIELEMNQSVLSRLTDAGIDEFLARHIAHLYIRDPLVIFKETLVQDDTKQNSHFENIQSTNWQTVRFKPPHPSGTTGWRVEFRSLEVQMTDFENAAFSILVALMGRAILYFSLNFYMPLSKVDENLRRAHKQDAIFSEKFFFRKYVELTDPREDNDELVELTLSQLLEGKEQFPGFIPIIEAYLDAIKCDSETRLTTTNYLNLLRRRAKGELMTAAAWMRKFATSHPAYKKDSRLNEEIVFDLMKRVIEASQCDTRIVEMMGEQCP